MLEINPVARLALIAVASSPEGLPVRQSDWLPIVTAAAEVIVGGPLPAHFVTAPDYAGLSHSTVFIRRCQSYLGHWRPSQSNSKLIIDGDVYRWAGSQSASVDSPVYLPFVASRARSLTKIVSSVRSSVGASGTVQSVLKKDKFCALSAAEIRAIVTAQIQTQGGVCAISGVKFDDSIPLLSPSWDRIDSNCPDYSVANTQVVAWVINRAKGSTPDPEFRKVFAALVSASGL